MNVSAVIVTRGNVDIQPVLRSLPKEWEQVVWDNGAGICSVKHPGEEVLDANALWPATDLSVYGRYAAIEHASHDLIYVQDDDVIVSDPQWIVEEWLEAASRLARVSPTISPPSGGVFVNVTPSMDHLVANMPAEFRHDGYTDSCLVGFGACCERNLPERAFHTFQAGVTAVPGWQETHSPDVFRRACDVVFTTLTPRVFVDVPKTDREFASDPDRMWRQPDHVRERTRMLDLARKVRDA